MSYNPSHEIQKSQRGKTNLGVLGQWCETKVGSVVLILNGEPRCWNDVVWMGSESESY